MSASVSNQRRLAAILAADVAGYSRHVALDEANALTALRRLRAEVLEPAIASHGGRLFKAMGDGFLVEFPSTVEALRCALAIQAGNGGEGVLRLRIGLHAGDVVIEGEDLLGDGVNVAARIEGLAEPGGIALSARVREDAAGRVSLAALEDLGEQALKNIPVPVRVFRLAPGAAPAAPAQAPKLAALDRPALAVLPFANMSGDAEQEYFADGITEELITQLSRARWFYVIARNSTFTYKGHAVDIRQVGRELGVRYVLEGSVRRAGNRVRITGQLIEAETGHHVWADRFDGALDDIFDLQDHVAEAVSGAVEPSLQHAEMRRAEGKPTESLGAYDLYLKALPRYYALTRQDSAVALELLRRATALDPNFALGKALAAYCQLQRAAQRWGTEDDRVEGTRLAREALAAHKDDPATLRLAGHAVALLGCDVTAGLAAAARALSLNPNSGQVALSAGWICNYAAQAEPALRHFERAIRLSPLDPDMMWIMSGMGMAHLVAGDAEQALHWADQTRRIAPNWTTAWRIIAVANWFLGREAEARSAIAELLRLAPDSYIGHLFDHYEETFRRRYVAALHAAGLPK